MAHQWQRPLRRHRHRRRHQRADVRGPSRQERHSHGADRTARQPGRLRLRERAGARFHGADAGARHRIDPQRRGRRAAALRARAQLQRRVTSRQRPVARRRRARDLGRREADRGRLARVVGEGRRGLAGIPAVAEQARRAHRRRLHRCAAVAGCADLARCVCLDADDSARSDRCRRPINGGCCGGGRWPSPIWSARRSRRSYCVPTVAADGVFGAMLGPWSAGSGLQLLLTAANRSLAWPGGRSRERRPDRGRARARACRGSFRRGDQDRRGRGAHRGQGRSRHGRDAQPAASISKRAV